MYFIGETILIKAAKYYKMAAAENHTQAMYNLALMYREGEGVKQDTGKAIDRSIQLSQKTHDACLLTCS